MSKGRKSVKAPEWFDISKYAVQQNFGPKDWLVQIGVRRDLLALAKGLIIVDRNEQLKALVELIHDNPIVNLEDLSEKVHPDWVGFLPSLEPLTEMNPNNSLAVHPTTLAEYCRINPVLDDERNEYIKRLYSECSESLEAKRGTSEFVALLDDEINGRRKSVGLESYKLEQGKTPYRPFMEDPIYKSCNQFYGSAFFSVDLFLPDKLLEAHFKKSLRIARGNLQRIYGSPKQMRSNFMQQWADEEILAYFDLSLEKYTIGGVNLSQADIATLLWPDDGKTTGSDMMWGEEHLTNTTGPRATELLDLNSEEFNHLKAIVAGVVYDGSKEDAPISNLHPIYRPTRTRRNRWRKTNKNSGVGRSGRK